MAVTAWHDAHGTPLEARAVIVVTTAANLYDCLTCMGVCRFGLVRDGAVRAATLPGVGVVPPRRVADHHTAGRGGCGPLESVEQRRPPRRARETSAGRAAVTAARPVRAS